MRIGAFLTRWVEVLAALLFSWREAWRARRSLVVSRDGAGFVIRQAGAESDRPLATAAVGAPVAKNVADAARKSLVVLELPAEKAIARQISVPAKAREFLPGVIRNQIDRLSPWQADEAVYGFAATASRDDASALDVQVMITSRAVVEAARAEITALRLAVDRIVVRGGAAAAPVVLWSRLANARWESGGSAGRLIGIAIAGCVALSFAVSVWALLSAASIRDASEDLATRTKSLERQLHAARGVVVNASHDPQESAWIAKQIVPSAVGLLEALSRELPDTAYLTNLQFERATVRMVGLAAEAPALIAPLEQSGHFSNVHFFAPTTRDADATRYQFHIEAHVEPPLDTSKD